MYKNTRKRLKTKTMVKGLIPYKDVTDSDVLCGRGNGPANHKGNQFLCRLITKYCGVYHDKLKRRTTRKDKNNIVLEIINKVKMQDPPGRFLSLKEDVGTGLVWIQLNERAEKLKISQALRDAKKYKNNSTKHVHDDQEYENNRKRRASQKISNKVSSKTVTINELLFSTRSCLSF